MKRTAAMILAATAMLALPVIHSPAQAQDEAPAIKADFKFAVRCLDAWADLRGRCR